LKFGFRYLEQVLFSEKTIPEKPDAYEKRLKRRQEINEHKHQELLLQAVPQEYDHSDEGPAS